MIKKGIIWIGKTPRVNFHVVNDKFKKLIHLNNVSRRHYDPHFLPCYLDKEAEIYNRTFFKKLIKQKELEDEMANLIPSLLDSDEEGMLNDLECDDADGLLIG